MLVICLFLNLLLIFLTHRKFSGAASVIVCVLIYDKEWATLYYVIDSILAAILLYDPKNRN